MNPDISVARPPVAVRGTNLASGPRAVCEPFDSEEDEMSRKLPLRITLAAALYLSCLTPDAHAQDEHRGFSLDLYGAYLSDVSRLDEEEDNHKGFALHGSYRFNHVWALDGSIAQFGEEGEVERLTDISAKAYLLHWDRFEGYALAGGGHSRLGGMTLHLGLGAEISLGRRLFLRPEVRGRWLDHELDAEPAVENSLGVGWRF
jgi:Outer membrane protein beta-barrel domain